VAAASTLRCPIAQQIQLEQEPLVDKTGQGHFCRRQTASDAWSRDKSINAGNGRDVDAGATGAGDRQFNQQREYRLGAVTSIGLSLHRARWGGALCALAAALLILCDT
jgi:hypothetical protein